MAPPVLYSTEISPPCRAVLLTVAAAGIKLNIKETNLIAGEHRTEEYIKVYNDTLISDHFLEYEFQLYFEMWFPFQINPQHTIPTLDDDGFILVDRYIFRITVALFYKDECKF